jgi:hypothetical protein
MDEKTNYFPKEKALNLSLSLSLFLSLSLD